MESNTAQKAIVNLGGPTCQVYQVIPQPILDVSIEITFTAPDNSTATTLLSTDGTEPAFGQATLDGVVFSTRINKVDTIGSAGPQIAGYLVVCGMDSFIPKTVDACLNLQKQQYNPYDPAEGDPDISMQKPEDDPFCTDYGGDVRQFRGVFPDNAPQKNPWPQLINKMVEARTQSGDPPPTGTYTDEGFACAVPSQRYYGVLNCGKPVSYYYVPEERKSSYGLDCTQIGVQNKYAFDQPSARRMCLQDDNSCTPGYGLPKFTASNAPFYRSPCQEIGDMVKTFHNLYAEDGSLNVCEHTIPSAWNMPGFTYLKDTDQYVPPGKAAQNVVGVPNTWLHEGYLYQQMSTSEQQSVRFDMSTYTDTYFGGNIITYSGGILVLEQGNTTVCVANVGSQPGILVVGVENTNTQSGGTYVMQLSCTNPQNNNPLDVNTTGGEAVIQPDGSGTQLVQVAAGDTRYITWGISANGYIPQPSNDTDDDPSTDPDSIGLPTCTVTLYSGPIAQPNYEISDLTINCNLLALNIIQNNRQTSLLTSIETSYNCGDYSLVVLPFCWLTNMGPIRTSEILLIFVLIGIASALLGYLGLQALRANMELEVESGKLTEALHQNELTKEKRQALLVQETVKGKQ
jgi:hypothetical protein